MKKFTLLLLMLLLIGINFSSKAQTYVPLTISSGFNADVIANGNNSAASSTSVVYDDATSYGVYYSEDYNPSGSGHPCGGIPSAQFTSLTSSAVYQLANVITSGNNCLFLQSQNEEGTLIFSNPGSFEKISICASSSVSTQGIFSLAATLNFSDGTHVLYSFEVPDWFQTAPTNYCIWNLGRTFRAGGSINGFDGCNGINGPNNSRMFDCIITLSSGDKVKILNSITCKKTDATGQHGGIFAVCGVTALNAPHAPIADAGTSLLTTSFYTNWHPYSPDDHPPTSYLLDVSTDPNFGSFVGVYNNYGVGSVTTLQITGLTPGATYYYRVRGVNSFGTSANSNVITVNLPSCANPTYPGAIAADQTNCGSFTPAAFTSTAAPTGYTGNLEYKWQYSVSPFSTWTDISSSNSSTYAPGLLTVTTKYRRLARVDCMSDWTGAAASDTLTVTINTIPQQFNVTGGGSYCAEGTGVAVGLSGSTSGISYALYNGASLVTTMTGTGSSLNFGLQTAAGTYTVVATDISTSCTNNMSGSATVIILPLPTPVISGPDVVTQGETVNYSTPDVPGHQYIWNIYLGTPVLCGGGCVNVTWAHICNIIEQGKVTVIETNLATGCTKTVYKMITIN